MPKLSKAEKRRQLIESLRNPKMASNSNAAMARFHDVTPIFVAKLRKEVEAESPAFQPGTHHELNIDDIRCDSGCQPRAKLDKTVAKEYRDDINGGSIFPAVGVVYDGTAYWLWDGFHRVEAHKMAKREVVMCEVRQGTRRDAVLLAAGANANHGFRRTSDDKRRSVEHLLHDPEWAGWSNERIAEKCCVSPMTVGRIRTELEEKGEISPNNVRAGADGKNYSVNPKPSQNGHATTSNGQSSPPATTSSPSATPTPTKKEPSPAPQEPPSSEPVWTSSRVSVTLNGDVDEDAARLIEAYPKESLRSLANQILNLLSPLSDEIPDRWVNPPEGSPQAAVLTCLRSNGRLTRAEIVDLTGLPDSTVGGRLPELARAGHVRDTGEKKPTPSGRKATLWEAV